MQGCEVKLKDIEERDNIRNFQPPITGEDIIKAFELEPSKLIGEIKDAIKDAIIEGIIPNERSAAIIFMKDKGAEFGLKLINEIG